MAKWGEGDPRWIVEERADATNVNNWHWTERDVTGWSQDTLRRLLLGVQVGGAEGVCRVTEVSKLEGEASINNRKGKLIYFYEWLLRAAWMGTAGSGIRYRGSVEVCNLSDENDADDLDISVSLCKDEPNTPLLALMKSDGVQEIRKVLGEYVRLLKSEFTQGMILPTANAAPPPQPPKQNQVKQNQVKQNQVKTSKTQISPAPSPAPSSTGVRIPTCSFCLNETFLTSADELYKTFINQEFVQAFTRSAAQVEPQQGGRFQLLDGSVSGRFAQLVPDEKIVMRWRFKSWPSEHHATVTLQLQERGEETELTVTCEGVPAAEEDRTREGWRRFYFHAIKQTFGYGAPPY